MSEQDPDELLPHHDSRARLVLEVIVFQFKLAADGLRDILLVPVSIGAAIVGLLGGGDRPDQYFRKLQRLGRRSEMWLNLFGHRARGNTADELVRPLEESLLAKMRGGGTLTRSAKHVNRVLDDVNERHARKVDD